MARRDYGLHKVGKVWHCEFRVGEAYVHRSTKRQDYESAWKVAKGWHDEALDRSQGLPTDTDLTVEKLWERWLEWARVHHSESHVNRVKADWDHHILPTVGKRLAKSLRDADAEALRTAFLAAPSRRNEHYGKAQNKPRTTEGANKVMRHLRLVFRWGVKPAGVLARVPFSVIVDVPEEPQRTFLRQEQIRPFLDAVDRGYSLHLKVAVRLQLMLGLREKEALHLRWESFNADLSEVTPPGKTKNAPPLPVPAELQAWLCKLTKKDEEREGLVLPNTEGNPHPPRYTAKAVERGALAVKLKGKLTPHRMRGSYATMLVRAGGEAHLIKKALRHDLLETSDKYVKLDISDLAEAQDRIFGPAPQKTRKLSKRKALNILIKRH